MRNQRQLILISLCVGILLTLSTVVGWAAEPVYLPLIRVETNQSTPVDPGTKTPPVSPEAPTATHAAPPTPVPDNPTATPSPTSTPTQGATSTDAPTAIPTITPQTNVIKFFDFGQNDLYSLSAPINAEVPLSVPVTTAQGSTIQKLQWVVPLCGCSNWQEARFVVPGLGQVGPIGGSLPVVPESPGWTANGRIITRLGFVPPTPSVQPTPTLVPTYTPQPTATPTNVAPMMTFDFEDGSTQQWNSTEGGFKNVVLSLVHNPVKSGYNALGVVTELNANGVDVMKHTEITRYFYPEGGVKDLSGKKVGLWAYFPHELIDAHNGRIEVLLFVKDKVSDQIYHNQYDSRIEINQSNADQWLYFELTVGTLEQGGHIDSGFDTTKIIAVGLRLEAYAGFSFSGHAVTIDEVKVGFN